MASSDVRKSDTPVPSKTEDKFYSDLMSYKQTGDQQALARLIDNLHPVIMKGINAFGQGNKMLLPHAKLLAKTAIDNYEAGKTSIESYVMLNLQRLQRIAPRISSPIQTSESNLILFKQVKEAEKELQDELGRPPSDQEIADKLGKSLKAIEKSRQAMGATVESTFQGNVSVVAPQEGLSERQKIWIETMYKTLSGTDQFIADNRFGLHGRQKMTLQQIANALNMPISSVANRIKHLEEMFNPPDLI
mgnify:CR=1 FL=1